MYILTIILTQGNGHEITFKSIWNNLIELVLNPNNKWQINLIQAFTIVAILVSFLIYQFASYFRRIVHKEMEKGGEEYGEIAATKVVEKSSMWRMLSIIFFVLTVVALILGVVLA